MVGGAKIREDRREEILLENFPPRVFDRDRSVSIQITIRANNPSFKAPYQQLSFPPLRLDQACKIITSTSILHFLFSTRILIFLSCELSLIITLSFYPSNLTNLPIFPILSLSSLASSTLPFHREFSICKTSSRLFLYAPIIISPPFAFYLSDLRLRFRSTLNRLIA